MSHVKKRSVLPVYLVGVTWLLWSIFLSLHRVSDFLLCAGVSLLAYFVGKIIFPDRGYDVPDETASASAQAAPQAEASASDPEIAALLDERAKAMSEMRRLNASIKDAKISAQITHLEATTGKIIDAVVKKPSKLPQIRKFLNYYLPTTLKLLNAYDRMDSAGVSGTNIDGTKGKIEDMLNTICVAFSKQLDNLYGEDALDISADIAVMEQMLQQEGLNSADGGPVLEL